MLRQAVEMAPPLTPQSDPMEIARVSLLSALAGHDSEEPEGGEASPWPVRRQAQALSMRRLAEVLSSPRFTKDRSFAREQGARSDTVEATASAAPEFAVLELLDRRGIGPGAAQFAAMQDETPDGAIGAVLAMERDYVSRIDMMLREWIQLGRVERYSEDLRIPYLRAELIDWRLLASHVALRRAEITRLPVVQERTGAVSFIRELAGEIV